MIIRLQVQLLLPQTLTLPSSLVSSPNPSQNPNPKKHHTKPLTPLLTPTTASSGPGHRFRQKMLYLKTLNVNPQKALEINPNFRSTPLETLKSVERFLSSIGIERGAFGRILEMLPHLLSADPYSDLYPVFDFLLNDVGIPYPDIRKSILRCPRLLVSSVDDRLRPTLLFLKGIGFVGKNAINSQTSVLLISSVENTLIPKLNFLKGLGFGYDEVRTLVWRMPSLLTFSVERNFRPKVQYFLEEMNGDLGQLKGFPQYFGYSLEGRIKPRHRMLAQYGFSLSLPEMLKYSDAEFNVRFLDMQVRLAEDGCSGYGELISSPNPTNNPNPKQHSKTRIPLTPLLTTPTATATSDTGHRFCGKNPLPPNLKVYLTNDLKKTQVSDQPHLKPSNPSRIASPRWASSVSPSAASSKWTRSSIPILTSTP